MPRPRKNTFSDELLSSLLSNDEAEEATEEITEEVTEPEVTVHKSEAIPVVTVGDYEAGKSVTLPYIVVEPTPEPVNLDDVETIYPLPPKTAARYAAYAAKRAAREKGR